MRRSHLNGVFVYTIFLVVGGLTLIEMVFGNL